MTTTAFLNRKVTNDQICQPKMIMGFRISWSIVYQLDLTHYEL
jgi:hypothetical protein